MNALLILGDQLFDPRLLPTSDTGQPLVFMREDVELCTHFKYHKHKIIFFLSAMRKYAEELHAQGFKVHYEKLHLDGGKYEASLSSFLKEHSIQTLDLFEIEDKFFEERILSTLKKHKIEVRIHPSPMFLTSREGFKSYLEKSQRPFMKTFYEQQRRRLKILVDSSGKPIGGQWSFDQDNRKPLPKNYQAPSLPSHRMDDVELEVAQLVDHEFKTHPGDSQTFWLPTDRVGARKWLRSFLQERFRDFGPYEDALSKEHAIINHSVLTPFLNTGLLTPQEVISETLKATRELKIPLASCEGFIRQIIGWREFIRGIYRNYSTQQETTNFWSHKRKLKDCWYKATTGIPPLDDVIQKTLRLGYAHHIERLMVVGSLMLLLEVDPHEAHRWFMEMFIDSSDWVMGPNVYGMALFSDGGIFATKPYFCGSNYYRKMGGYRVADWQLGVDGLYWSFIDKHRDYFLKNPRLSMMVRTLDKMAPQKKNILLEAAAQLRKELTMD